MKHITVEALGGAQAVPSDLIPGPAPRTGNVMLTNADGVPAAMVMAMTQFRLLIDELAALRRQSPTT